MKRLLFALGSLALVALLGITMVGRSGADAQNSATPEASGTPTTEGGTSSGTAHESAKDIYLATLAEKLGISQEDLRTAIDATNEELGMDGSMVGGMGGPGHMHRGGSNNMPGRGGSNNGNWGQGGMTAPPRATRLREVDIAKAAIFFGITEDDLRTELRDGKTFLAIAQAHGKTLDEIRAFLIGQATADIDTRLQEAEDAAATPAATEVPAQPANTAVPTGTPTVTA